MAERRNIMVVGVPRSGTSLTAAIFARQGYHLGQIERESMRRGDANNPFGYFEADDIIARNVEVLQRTGFGDDNTWVRDMISAGQIEAIDGLEPAESHREFLRRYQDYSPWVWKDPRLTLTLPYWWKLVDRDRTGVILVCRKPEDSYRSFVRVGWYEATAEDRQEVLRRIDVHLDAARRAIDKYDIPHIRVDYEAYFDHPEATAERIGAFSGLRLGVEDLNVHRDLRHSRGRGRLAAWIRRSADSGLLRHLRPLKPLVPRSLLAWLLPEKKYLD